MAAFEWKVCVQTMGEEKIYQVWKQTRELYPGEPMHSGVRKYYPKFFGTKEAAQKCADELNQKEEEGGSIMKSILKLKLYGYAVRGVDRRDGAGFEGHIVVSNLNGSDFNERAGSIERAYSLHGFIVNNKDIIPDEKPGYNPDKGIAIDLDLHQMYLEQLKALEEQREASKSESRGNDSKEGMRG